MSWRVSKNKGGKAFRGSVTEGVSLVMRTSAKNTLCSEALIFILELLSQVKSDCHENL